MMIMAMSLLKLTCYATDKVTKMNPLNERRRMLPGSDNSRRSRGHLLGLFTGMGVLAAFTALLCLVYVGNGSPGQTPSTLQFVAMVFRHGDRTPTDTFPSDPYKNESFWPEGLGQLTQIGKSHSYQLGLWMRQRYSAFLPELYSSNDVYVVSSDYDRCIMTAQLLLAGLYPPQQQQIWKDDIKWQPVPVHTIPVALDQLIVMKKPCPRYDSELAKLRIESEPEPGDVQLFQYLSKYAGKNISSILDVEFMYNTLEIEAQRGLELPTWTSAMYPEPGKTIAMRSLSQFTGNTILQRLRAGPMLKDIISRMSEKSSGNLKPDRRLFLYSAHDITLVSFLQTLQVPNIVKPDYNAAVILELHRSTEGQFSVQTFYLKNATVSEPDVIETSCEHPCSLSGFIAGTKAVVPENWDQECLAELQT